MQQTIPATRRRLQAQRRDQLRRRRFVALALVGALVALAVWAAYSIPGSEPAPVPQSAGAPGLAASAGPAEDVVVARVESVDLLLPVVRGVTTAVAFRPVDNAGAVPLQPSGKRASGGSLGQRLADVFAGGGGLQYYIMEGGGGAGTAGLDVGAVPGSAVTSPVDGKVVGVKKYRLFDRYDDVEVQIQLAGDPSLLLIVTHLAKVKVAAGDNVTRGETALGEVRGFPATLDQALSRYTSDAGDHVQLMVLRITSDLGGL